MFGWLQTIHATEVSRNANRATYVGADLQGYKTGGNRCGRAAAGPTGRAVEVPGVVGAAKYEVLGLEVSGQRGHISLAEDDRTGGPETRGNGAVFGWNVARQRFKPRGGPHPCDRMYIFERQRHSMERAPDLAAGKRIIGGPCALASPF